MGSGDKKDRDRDRERRDREKDRGERKSKFSSTPKDEQNLGNYGPGSSFDEPSSSFTTGP
jgi:hypothetical protein